MCPIYVINFSKQQHKCNFYSYLMWYVYVGGDLYWILNFL